MCERNAETKDSRSTTLTAPVCLGAALVSWQVGALVGGVTLAALLPLPIVLAALRNRWWLPSLCATIGFAAGQLAFTNTVAQLVHLATVTLKEIGPEHLAFALAYAGCVVVARFSPVRCYRWLALGLLPLAWVTNFAIDERAACFVSPVRGRCDSRDARGANPLEFEAIQSDPRRAGFTTNTSATLTRREARTSETFETSIENAQEKSCTNALAMRKMPGFPLSSFAPRQLVGARWTCHEGLN